MGVGETGVGETGVGELGIPQGFIPLAPHIYIVQLGLTGVHICLILALTCVHNLCSEQK